MRKGAPRKNSIQYKDGIRQADHHYVKQSDKVYTLSELLDGCRLKTVSPLDGTEVHPSEPVNPAAGRNCFMFYKAFPEACKAYRKGSRDIFSIYKRHSSNLPDCDVRASTAQFLRWADGEGHERIMSFIDWSEHKKPFEGRRRWSDNHVSWDKIAEKFGLTKDQARYRFGSYEEGLDQYYRLIRMEIKKKEGISSVYKRWEKDGDLAVTPRTRGWQTGTKAHNADPAAEQFCNERQVKPATFRKWKQRGKVVLCDGKYVLADKPPGDPEKPLEPPTEKTLTPAPPTHKPLSLSLRRARDAECRRAVHAAWLGRLAPEVRERLS